MIIINKEERKNKDVKTLKKEENKMFFTSKNNTKGITLIALVITIIVLLILAGVTIAMLTGENGILNKASKSQTENTVGKEKEEIGLAYSYAKADKLQKADTGDVTRENLEEGFNKNGATNVALEGNNPIKVTFSDSKNVYEIDNSGNITGPVIGGTPEDVAEEITNIDIAKTNPEGAKPENSIVIKGDGNNGIVIKDSNKNEWVWIEVPKTIYTTATGKTDYTNIETDMQTYATAYRESGWTDTFYSKEQHGFADGTEYNNWKNTMLTSVYENGGFYIGRYEVGDETVTGAGNLGRTSSSGVTGKAVIKQDMYPYNYVTCSQSQTLAKGFATGGKTSSLMFGIQWDLVCKYMEEKGTELGTTTTDRQTKIKSNSSTWGNYWNVTFDITKGKYSTDYGVNFNPVSPSYTKPESSSVLLTTGAVERNKVLNIYDFAGNEYEWILEKSTYTSYPCADRGGYCDRNRC